MKYIARQGGKLPTFNTERGIRIPDSDWKDVMKIIEGLLEEDMWALYRDSIDGDYHLYLHPDVLTMKEIKNLLVEYVI
jgi:hypothetical protein